MGKKAISGRCGGSTGTPLEILRADLEKLGEGAFENCMDGWTITDLADEINMSRRMCLDKIHRWIADGKVEHIGYRRVGCARAKVYKYIEK